MPSFEEEAFSRAQQMHRGVPNYHSPEPQRRSQPRPSAEKKETPEKPPKAEVIKPECETQADENSLSVLFKNKEQSLILLLIVLLMEENAEPTLLLALVYLLI